MNGSYEFGRLCAGMTAAELSDGCLAELARQYARIAGAEIGARGAATYLAGCAAGYRDELDRRRSPERGQIFQGADAAEFGPAVGLEIGGRNV